MKVKGVCMKILFFLSFKVIQSFNPLIVTFKGLKIKPDPPFVSFLLKPILFVTYKFHTLSISL
ncbi:hypothetical protein BD770DRAFT_160819 [Pilaira anomala]|nr:hypothetical protein BD770DRAFT_160819 [Pilaira anomala]